MPERPFLEWPLEQLEEHARQHAADFDILRRVLQELGVRPGRAARDVARRLEARLAPSQGAPAADHPGPPEVQDLRRLLDGALRDNAKLRARLAAAEHCQVSAEPLGRLGLAPTAPRWLILAARRAYRRELHPDRATVDDRSLAEARFKEAEALFETILREK